MRLLYPILVSVLLCRPVHLPAQVGPAEQTTETSAVEANASLPDAPLANGYLADQQTNQESPTVLPSAPQSQAETDQEKREKAREQLKEQKSQRILGIFPAFNTSYRKDAVSLTSKEKMGLAFRSAVDPMAFSLAFIVAGISETSGNAGFGWGPEGYFKRTGAAYLDSFNAKIIGKGMLPSLLRQDPRYFRRGYGSTTRRLLYASGSVVICKHDTGRWEPNYSNVGGIMVAGMISNSYYPDTSASGVQKSLVNGLVVTVQGMAGAMFQEFWPDLSRKLFHKDPTHGLDAQAAAAHNAGKDAKQPQER